jgi:hypothetical protein
MAKSTKIELDLSGVRFNALRNAHYHMARQAWFDRLNRFCNFLVIIAGTAIAYQVSQRLDWVGFLVAFLTTAVGALQLVFDFGGMAHRHEILKKKYFDVAARIEELKKPTIAAKAKINSNLISISAEEPPSFRALDAIAHNQIVDAIHGNEGKAYKCKVTSWQHVTRHFLYHASANFTE